MKNLLRTVLFIIFLSIVRINTFAYDFDVDGIYYNILADAENMVEVTYKDNPISGGTYRGTLDIPSKVVYDGKEYTVTQIGESGCRFCSHLEKVIIPKTVNKIQSYAFESTSISEITIPNSVVFIGKDALKTNSIKTLIFENGSNDLELESNSMYGAFETLHHLEKLHLGRNLITSSARGSFYGINELKEVTIGNDVKELKSGLFYGCQSIEKIVIPNSVTTFSGTAFSYCKGLKSVVIEDGEEPLSFSPFNDKWTSLDSLYVGRNCSASGNGYNGGLFSGGASVTSVFFGHEVTIIPFKMLSGTGVKRIYLTNNIQEFQLFAFGYNQLTDVYCYSASLLPIHSDTFVETPVGNATLHIPLAAFEEYKNHDTWGKFGSFVELPQIQYVLDGEVYKVVVIPEGDHIIPEAEPAKEGYTFSGWSEIPETMPDHNVTVTGSFTVNKYKLIYKVDDKEYKTIDVEYGASITAEAEPTKEGYTFSGWSLIPETMPANDVLVTGSFTKGQYKLTYMLDGETYKTISLDFGTTITAEEEPAKEGYTFSGWSEIPATMPAKDVTVTGSFVINKYKLIYQVDGEDYKTYEVEYGANLTPEVEPSKDSYSFSGWSEIPSTMPAEDVTITGYFTFIDAIEDVVADDGSYEIYTLDGKQVKSLQKGVNIIRYSNGSTQKVFVK